MADITEFPIPTKEFNPNDFRGEDGTDGADGEDGREVEVQANSTHIQWRYVGDAEWIDLVALSELEGPQGPQGDTGPEGPQGEIGPQGEAGEDGAPVELRVEGDYIQWKLTTDTTWQNLTSLDFTLRETVYTTTNPSLDRDNGGIQVLTISAAETISVTMADGDSMLVILFNTNEDDVTWPSGDWVTDVPSPAAQTHVEILQADSTTYLYHVGDV